MSKPMDNELVIIGAGLPRTGTNSLQLALEQLTGSPCYHMYTLLESKDKSHVDFWTKLWKRQISTQDWKDFFASNGMKACVDFPCSFFYKELMRIYPNARVVLSVRDPESWYKSVRGSVYKSYELKQTHWHLRTLANWRVGREKLQAVWAPSLAYPDGFDAGMFEAIENGQDSAVDFYNNWVQKVKEHVPKDRLLIHNAKEGWGPLCDFLGVPVPSDPYPRVNDTKKFQDNQSKSLLISRILFIVLPLAVTGIGLLFMYKNKLNSCFY